ncbi:MAG: T9SS type A sorting domain-containing protein [Bacteroidetes bacterium]|nr:T9SS type A sorting domain-containing protein [Bacteroidota bacterium]
MKRTAHFISLLVLLWPVVLPAQATTDVYPVEVAPLDNQTRLNSFFWRFEQRIKAHDAMLVRWAFDSLVEAGGTPDTDRNSVRTAIREALQPGVYPDSVLISMYESRAPGYLADFHILEVAALSSISSMATGDTMSCVVSISTGPNDPVDHCLVQVKKVHERDGQAASSFRITRYTTELIQAISRYGAKYAVVHAGENNGLFPMLRESDWEDYWDFIRDDEKECVEIVDEYQELDDGLIHVPITVWAGTDTYQYDKITMAVTMDKLNSPVLNGISDFFVTANNDEELHRLIISDEISNRIYIADLSLGYITSNPGYKGQDSWGYDFAHLDGAYYYSPADEIYTYDKEYDKIQRFTVNMFEPGGMTGGDYIDVNMPLFSGFNDFAVPHALWPVPGDFPTWFRTVLLSVKEGGTPFLEYHIMNRPYSKSNPDIRYVGIETACGQHDFPSAPAIGVTGTIASYDINQYHLEQVEIVALGHGDELYMCKHALEDAYDTLQTHYLQAIGSLRFPNRMDLLRFNTPMERLFDGTVLLADSYENAIHVIEPEDGKYICTLTEGNFLEGTELKLVRSVKYLPGSDGLTVFDYEDLYVSEIWTETSGFSRYLLGGKIVTARIARSSDAGHDQILARIYGRAKIRTQLVLDDQVISESATIIANTGEYLFSVVNPDRYDIRLWAEAASNVAYGAFAQAPHGVMLPLNGPEKRFVEERNFIPSGIDVEIWPTITENRITARIHTETEQLIGVRIYDMLGRMVSDQGSSTFSQGISYVHIYAGRLSSGAYLLAFVTGAGTETRKIIVR